MFCVYPSLIRRLCEHLDLARASVPIYFVVLGESISPTYLRRILQEIDGELGDSAKIILLSKQPAEHELVRNFFSVDLIQFCAAVRGGITDATS